MKSIILMCILVLVFAMANFHLYDSFNLKIRIFIKKTSMEASVAFHSAVQTL